MRDSIRRWGGPLGLAVVVALLAGNFAWGLMTSVCGNQPLSPENYKSWPGLVDVVNDPHRVLNVWVNGNEDCWYHGDTDAVNVALESFWRADLESYQVVLLPGPGQTITYNGMTVTSNWRLHILGGIAKSAIAKENDKTGVFDVHPTFYVYVSQPADLQKLKIPAGLELLGPTDIRERFFAGLKEGSKTTRGHAAILLATVDSHSEESAQKVASLLDEGDPWLSGMALSALEHFGANGLPVLEKLQKHKPENDLTAKTLARVIKSIKEAKPRTEDDKKTRELIEKVDAFVATNRK